jgi:hypothetical protein
VTFSQLTTLLAIVTGPFGVTLGFGLSMLGERVKAKREANEKQCERAVTRALELLAAASTVAEDGRVLAYAAYLQARGRHPVTDQVQGGIDRFNAALAILDRLILEADVLGPDGLGHVGRTLRGRAGELSAVLNDMNESFASESAKKVQHEILPAFVTAIEDATVQVRALLKVGPQTVTPQSRSKDF